MAESTTGSSSGTHRAGLFDIRIIIAALIGLYGVIVLITGLFVNDKQIDKSGGLNINVTAGIVMILVAAAFTVWARLRPTIVKEPPASATGTATTKTEDTPG